MMGPIWWVRLARWARRPPSKEYVRIVLVVVGICAAIVGGTWFLGIELDDPGVNPRRGISVDVEIIQPN